MNRRPTGLARASVALVFAAGALSLARPAGAITHTFTFRDTLLPREGGPTLVPVYNGGSAPTILTEGMAGFTNGSFVTQTITARACASQPAVRAWSFPAQGGLRHPNMAPVVASGSYTISMLVRFNPQTGGYARLVDFSNSTLDTGIYELGGGVSFYPVGTYAAGSFVQAEDTFVTLTRDATSRVVNLYINGVASGTYTDAMDLYAPASGALYFFMDNTTGSAAISESNAGVVSYLQVADAPITPAQVVASLGEICVAVRCGNGVVEAGEGCDSGSGTGSATCDAMCRIRGGYPCNATAPGATGGASCASATCVTAGVPAPGRCAGCSIDAHCSGATPACSVATSTCVACTGTNATACTGSTPVCDVQSRTCVACNAVGAASCAAGLTCEASSGRCVTPTDAGVPDAGPMDSGAVDTGSGDVGNDVVDATTTVDAGRPDAGTPDAGRPDAGRPDTGTVDVGTADVGTPDVGEEDAGEVDAGEADAGLSEVTEDGACGCRAAGSTHPGGGSIAALAALALATTARRRRRARTTP